MSAPRRNSNKITGYNVTIAGAYKLKNGNYWTMPIDAKTFDALQKAKIGDRLLVKHVSEETLKKKGEKFPPVFLEIVDASNLKPKSSPEGDWG